MTFDLFWVDAYIEEKLFGFGVFTIKGMDSVRSRSLFSVYWADGMLLLDLFYFKVLDC